MRKTLAFVIFILLPGLCLAEGSAKQGEGEEEAQGQLCGAQESESWCNLNKAAKFQP